jgi:transcriptional regulator with XRE-family HTH domain
MEQKQKTQELFSNRIRKYRKESNLGQKQMAFLMGLKSVATLSRYENGLLTPNLENLLSLELTLGISVRRLYPDIATRIAKEIRIRREKLSQVIHR